MLLTTKLVVGGLGYRELAAVGIANNITFELLVVFMGLLSVVGVFIAQAEIVADKTEAGHATRQGLLYAGLIGIPLTALIWNLGPLLTLLGQPPRIIELAIPYAHALAPSVLPVLWFSVLRSYVAALARPRAMMVITLIGVVINYFLTVALVRGTDVSPALGMAGAGWALSIVSWLMLIALIVHIATRDELRGYGLFHGRLRVDWRIWRELTVLGVPVAGLVLIEGGMFMSVSVLSGLMGAKTLAAYEILMAWVGFPFVIGLGIAEATMVRVAYGTGLKNLAVARQSGIVGMVLGSALLFCLVVFPVVYPEQIVDLFIDSTRLQRHHGAAVTGRHWLLGFRCRWWLPAGLCAGLGCRWTVVGNGRRPDHYWQSSGATFRPPDRLRASTQRLPSLIRQVCADAGCWQRAYPGFLQTVPSREAGCRRLRARESTAKAHCQDAYHRQRTR